MNLLLIISVTAVIGSTTYGFLQQLPSLANEALQSSGAQYLAEVITQENTALTDAVEEFKPINASCMTSYEQALASCKSCVKDKCIARAESVCQPSDWQIILGESINFLTDDIPNFFTDTVPEFFEDKLGGAFVDLGDEIVDLTKDVGNFFEEEVADAFANLGGEIEDAASDVGQLLVNAGNEVVGVANDIGDAFDDLGDGAVGVAEDIGKFAENVGEEIGNVVDTIGDAAGDIIDDIGDFFEDTFGRRKRSIRARRSAQQPSCSQIKANSTVACQFYLDQDFCIDCGFSTAKDCPGYDAAVEKIQTASANRKWMSKAISSSYQLVKTLFNPFNSNLETQTFNDVQVEVHMFGMDLQFTVSEPINPYIPETAGPIIAAQALQLFKSA